MFSNPCNITQGNLSVLPVSNIQVTSHKLNVTLHIVINYNTSSLFPEMLKLQHLITWVQLTAYM